MNKKNPWFKRKPFLFICFSLIIFFVVMTIVIPTVINKLDFDLSQGFFSDSDDEIKIVSDKILSLKTFFGFENNNTDEMDFVTSGIEIILMPSPSSVEELYVAKIPPKSSGIEEMCVSLYESDNDMLFGINFKVDNANPNPPLFLIGARENLNIFHFYLVLYEGQILLFDGADNWINISAVNTIQNDTWYRLETRLTKSDRGSLDVYLDGIELFSHRGDFDGNGFSGATQIFFSGQVEDGSISPMTLPNPVNLYISSGYYLGHGSSTNDFLGEFGVWDGALHTNIGGVSP